MEGKRRLGRRTGNAKPRKRIKGGRNDRRTMTDSCCGQKASHLPALAVHYNVTPVRYIYSYIYKYNYIYNMRRHNAEHSHIQHRQGVKRQNKGRRSTEKYPQLQQLEVTLTNPEGFNLTSVCLLTPQSVFNEPKCTDRTTCAHNNCKHRLVYH